MNTQTQKLHAYIAHCGIASRRAAEKMILEGIVKVNDKPAVIGQRITPGKDIVKIRNKPINTNEATRYFLVNKPVGVVSTAQDELNRKTVVELVPNVEERLYPVGRLDVESEGLMLLTNDGKLAHTLTHPSFEIMKTYHVLLKGIPSTPALMHLRRGVKLREGYVAPIEVQILRREEQKNTWISITIDEGMNHQVRRMISRIGYDVIRLIRMSMGPFELGTLRPGACRELSGEEVEQMKAEIDQYINTP